MAQQNESFNTDLYDLLKVRGYRPVPLNSKNQRVGASQEADVIEFTFKKDGEEYGKAWASIDDASSVIIYYDEEQSESPSDVTPGLEYDDSWTGFLKHVKNWAQRRQLDFELSNKDRLGDDMRQRDYYKMKEKLGESYHPMGKKASYNDVIPEVKIVLQHNRALEEGEARFRNVARIFLENADGERFLAPTTRPGIARVYARHIAEGGVPNDERWNHIKSICEDYNKMAGFVRATRKGQFNESAQALVNEGISHYNNLRETLHKMTTHRGYHAYFESYTPPLMEEENDTSVTEYFVQEMVDPRIESAMPILSRLHKNIAEDIKIVPEVDELAEWADNIIAEKLEMDSTTKSMAVPADKMLEAPGAETLAHNQSTEKSNLKAFGLAEDNKEHAALVAKYVKKYGEKEGKRIADEVYNTSKSQKKSAPAPTDNSDDTPKTRLQHFEKKAKKKITRRTDETDAEKNAANTKKTFPNVKHLTKGGHPDWKKHGIDAPVKDEVDEDLGPEQKRVGQLGPTEKVKNNNIGKLVGASESIEYKNDELTHITKLAGI